MIRRVRTRLRGEHGFTLPELIVVMAILGVLVAALSMALSMTVTQSTRVQDASVTQTEVRGLLDQMVRELRQAYTGDSTFPIKTATSTAIEFLSPDSASPLHNRRIAYRLTGGRVDRAITTSTNTGAPPWTGFAWSSFATIPATAWATRIPAVTSTTLFTYYGTSIDAATQRPVVLTGTIDPTKIGQVTMSVTVKPKARGQVFSYTTSATLRWQP